MPAHVYISYSYLDTKMAMAIADGLKKLGNRVTIAQEAMAVGGTNWRDVMDRGMEDCNALVVLVPQRSLDRPWVMLEIGAAHALKKRIIPIIFEGVREIPNYFGDITCLSAAGDRAAPVVKQINQALAGLDYRNVFIVHGQNEAKKLELKGFLSDL